MYKYDWTGKYVQARHFLDNQSKRISKLNGKRFSSNGYEYRLTYEGGFAPDICVDYRKLGKRNFKYLHCVDVSHCWDSDEALDKVFKEIGVPEGTPVV